MASWEGIIWLEKEKNTWCFFSKVGLGRSCSSLITPEVYISMGVFYKAERHWYGGGQGYCAWRPTGLNWSEMKFSHAKCIWELTMKIYLEGGNWNLEMMEGEKGRVSLSRQWHWDPLRRRFSLEGDTFHMGREILEYNTVCISKHIY